MRKLTVYGELYLKDEDFRGEWCADVELDDEQVRNLTKLIIFNCETDVERMCLKETYPDIFMTFWIRRATKQLLIYITNV